MLGRNKGYQSPDTYTTNSCHERDFLFAPFSANVYINIILTTFSSHEVFSSFTFSLNPSSWALVIENDLTENKINPAIVEDLTRHSDTNYLHLYITEIKKLTWTASYLPRGEPSVDVFVAVAPGSIQ